jgi:tRNA threonylcarbamoyladenosine modification (KEOPS) complex  Pcc1 subunit
MVTKAKACIRLCFKSETQVTTIFDALSPESKVPATRRAIVKLEKDGLFLVLEVEAKDNVALRATLNAYLRWINSTVNIINVIEQT